MNNQVLKIFTLFLLMFTAQGAWANPDRDYQRGLDAYLNEDLINAMQILEQAATQGHLKAQVLLAFILDKSEENEAAVKWYRMAADAGNPSGQVGLAGMYLTGEGIAKDIEKGRSLIIQAANKGYEPAMRTLSEAYANGEMGLQVDQGKSDQWKMKAEEAAKNKPSE